VAQEILRTNGPALVRAGSAARCEMTTIYCLVHEPPRCSLRLPGYTMTDRRHRQPRRDDMKLAVILAMALATLAAADSASAGAQKNAWRGQQASIGKGVAGGPHASKQAIRLRASGPPNAVTGPATQGIIMRDGGICDPIRHMGC
jgi:hypothetical protein